jgi:ligand-binding SRPBCC domain-containing protein
VRVHRIEREQLINRPLDEVFDFFAQARNLERITPPWLRFEVLTPEPIAMHPGTRIEYQLRLHAARVGWVSRIETWEPGRAFVDRQVRGPYRVWHHLHEFRATDDGTRVTDRVHYAMPFGPLGALAHVLLVRRDLARIFDFRQQAVARLLG